MIRLIVAAIVILGGVPAVQADDTFYPVSIPLKKERKSRLPGRSQPADQMEFGIWIPEGVAALRGIIMNPFTANPAVAPSELRTWHEMGRIWGFAFVQGDFNGTSADEFAPTLQEALVEAARKSGHPELVHAPFLFMGTSRGGGWSRKLAETFPDRTIAVAPTNLVVGPDTQAIRGIPFWTTVGERDGKQFTDIQNRLPVVRKEGGPWGVAVLWGAKHEFLFTNNLVLPFFDEVTRQRYPSDQLPKDQPIKLKPYPKERVWLGDVESWKEKKHLGNIAPAERYAKPHHEAVWLPGADVAHAWRAFVSEAKSMKIVEPPGLGGGQPFLVHPSDKEIVVKLKVPAEAKKVSLYDGERRLDTKDGAATEFTIRLATGVHPIYAVAETHEGPLYSRPHTLLVRKR